MIEHKRRRPPSEEPIPRDGLVERVAARTHARSGEWPAWFLEMLERAYGSRVVPRRFVERSEQERARLLKDREIMVLVEREEERLDRERQDRERTEQTPQVERADRR